MRTKRKKEKRKKEEPSTSGNLATKIKLPRRQRRKATIRARKQIYNIVRSFFVLKALKTLYLLSYLPFREINEKRSFIFFLLYLFLSCMLYEIN